MTITVDIPKNENWSGDDLLRFREIFQALVRSGGLSGVKNGKTIIHFDGNGDFQAIQLDYYPYKRRK